MTRINLGFRFLEFLLRLQVFLVSANVHLITTL